jgi:hypothetical protein
MYILAITKIFLGFAKEWTTKLVQCQQFKQKHKRRPKDLDTQKISKNMFSNILFYHPTIVQRIHVLGSLCQTVWPDWTTLCHWGKYPTLKFMSHRYEKIGISNGIRTWWHITILSEKKTFFPSHNFWPKLYQFVVQSLDMSDSAVFKGRTLSRLSPSKNERK